MPEIFEIWHRQDEAKKQARGSMAVPSRVATVQKKKDRNAIAH